MKDNDVILWQARIMAAQASMIDQMKHGLDEAQRAASDMVPASELEAQRAIASDLQDRLRAQVNASVFELSELRARVAELESTTAGQLQDHQRYVETIRRHEGTIESRVFELNELRGVRNEQAEVIANLEAALADRDKRLTEAHGASSRLALAAQPAAARDALYGLLNLIRQHDLTRAEILVYLYVLVHGKDGHAPPSTVISRAIGCDKSTPAACLRQLRSLGLVKHGALPMGVAIPSKPLNGDAPGTWVNA